MTRVVIREGAYALTSVHIYLGVVQLVMSYRLDTWFMSPYMERVWGWFHHMVDRRLTGRQHWRGRDGV